MGFYKGLKKVKRRHQVSKTYEEIRCFLEYIDVEKKQGRDAHCEQKPALTVDPDGYLFSHTWSTRGKVHRTNGPAMVVYNHKEIYSGAIPDYRTLERKRPEAIDTPAWYLNGEEVERFT